MFSLEGKTALVTGAGSGIGRATALRLAAAGARVVADDRDVAAAEATAQATDGSSGVADVADFDQVDAVWSAAARRTGRLDIVVNNAGIALDLADVDATTTDHLDAHLRVNTGGVLNGLRAARRHMPDGGAIVNTASVLGLIGTPGYASYSASKHAVIGLTKTAAVEFGPAGIRVNAVAPTTVDTPMLHTFAAGAQEAAAYSRASALGRIISADHVAALIHFLVADDCPVITGQTLAIDAGMSAGISAAAWESAADA